MGGMWQVLGANGAVWPETQYKTSLTLHLSCCHKAEHHFALPKSKSDLFKEWGIERIIKKVLETLQPLCSSNKPHNFFNHNEMDKIINMHMAKWKYVNNWILNKYQNIKFLFKQVLRKSVLKRIFWGKNSYYSILLSAFIANINSNGLGYFKKRIAKLGCLAQKVREREGLLLQIASMQVKFYFISTFLHGLKIDSDFFPTNFTYFPVKSGVKSFSFIML